MKKIFIFNCFILLSLFAFAQGVTTSSMQGQVNNQSGETLIGVAITATHIPTGTFYGTVSDNDGYYRMDNMKVGGPYKVTIKKMSPWANLQLPLAKLLLPLKKDL